MNKKLLLVILLTTAFLSGLGQDNNLKLSYNRPAKQWEESLPLGNGRLGMMPDGGILNEKIVLNDITLWSGSPQDANNYEAHKRLEEVRKLIAEGKNDLAQDIINNDFICRGEGSGNGVGAHIPFGSYQILANLNLRFSYPGANAANPKVEDYKRGLSLENAIANSSYRINGVNYTKEYFTSFGDDVNIIRISADKAKQLNCNISIDRPERFSTGIKGERLEISGALDNGHGENGMKYFGAVQVKLKDGTITTGKNGLTIKGASEIILYVSAKTDYKDVNFKTTALNILNRASKKNYSAQKQLHTAAFQKLFNRMSIKLGADTQESIPTDQRLVNFQKDPHLDPALPALFFQFGRYLLISSIRVGLLPPNLQGLWANQVQTPWNSDYHLDLNLQMCHWPVEVANLSELNLPLTDYVQGLVKNGERTAKAYYNADGWIAHVAANIWGFTEPGESANWGITKVGPGWLSNNLWTHYQYTGDKKYLAEIYPVIKGAAKFYKSLLVKDDKTGWLLTSPSSSPENAFYLPNGKEASICIGPTIDNQIMRELFTNVVSASTKLNVDPDFRQELQETIGHLAPVAQISKDGRIMEWMEDYKEVEPDHRHISHLYGLYPAALITPESTPELIDACKKTLDGRGDDGTGWSLAYKMLFWARLHDGDRAFKLYKDLMRTTLRTDINYGAGGGIYPNLLCAGPPFQIDGNFGGAAAIAEMLIQSHDGFIDLLPAIPPEWKAFGEIKGIKAQGNYTINMSWKDGVLTDYKIFSPNPGKVKVRANGQIEEVTATKI